MVGTMERTAKVIATCENCGHPVSGEEAEAQYDCPESLRQEIERAWWTWARTYAKTAPHWYILRQQYPGLFHRLSHVIRLYGTDREYRDTGQTYRYLVIGECQFWGIGVVLYRAHKDAR